MTSPAELLLARKRQALRERMQAQRQLIAEQLGPGTIVGGNYPRSRTMRFLTRRTGLVATLLAEGVALLVGGRYARSMTAVMTTAQVVRALSTGRPKNPPAPRADA